MQSLPSRHSTGYGFRASVFPLFAFILGSVTLVLTYHLARRKHPPSIDPFPLSDITHAARQYPEYIVFRVGMMVAPILFAITFQALKNHLESLYFKTFGRAAVELSRFNELSIISCLALCVSTATISDSDDMDWTVHTIGATSFFVAAMYMILKASSIYRQIWPHFKLCSWWSYQVKKYSNETVAVFLLQVILQALSIINWYAWTEWVATFYLLAYFLTLYWDLKDVEIVMWDPTCE